MLAYALPKANETHKAKCKMQNGRNSLVNASKPKQSAPHVWTDAKASSAAKAIVRYRSR